MTARYARLHDQTIKREVTRWHERVNIRGERISVDTIPLVGEANIAAAVRAVADDGSQKGFTVDVRVDTPQEVEYYRNGGILPYVLRQLAK